MTAGPAESPASDDTTPTNVGSAVTFTATGTDTNNDSYRFAVCKANGITPNGTGLPTCSGGSWCISGVTSSGVGATCSYTALSGDAESNAWYGFVCDSIAGSTCSASSQGTGASGSPFSVNHAPTFSAMTSTTADPGASVQFTATASDADIASVADTVKLIVCTSVGATASGCTVPANQLCVSTNVASNPTCSYTLPAVIPEGGHAYYAYVFDSHGLASTNSPFPSKSYTVTCSFPVWFFADPTDTGSPNAADDWTCKVTPYDTVGTGEVDTDAVEMNSLSGIQVPSSIGFGNLNPGTNTGATNTVINISNTGNTTLDFELAGTAMCKDYPTCSGTTIPVGNQQYKLSAFTYGTGTVLTTNLTRLAVSLAKSTAHPSNQLTQVYWGLSLPAALDSGSYTGSNTIIGVLAQ